MRSVNCWEAVSGEWARVRRMWAMWLVGAGEEVILEVYEPVVWVGMRMLALEAVEVRMWMVGVREN